MKASNAFKETIKAYLEKRASEDELFAVTYQKENKNLDECCNYVVQCAKEGKCEGYDPAEVFGWAVHYYDEDDVKNIKPISCRVVVNHSVELTEEEKLKARENAIEIATNQLVKEVKKDLKVNVQLSEEEIKEAKQEAIVAVVSQAKDKLTNKKTVKKEDQKPVEQIDLFG